MLYNRSSSYGASVPGACSGIDGDEVHLPSVRDHLFRPFCEPGLFQSRVGLAPLPECGSGHLETSASIRTVLYRTHTKPGPSGSKT